MEAQLVMKHDEVIRVPQQLRDYQREAIGAVKAAWGKDVKALVAIATGGGKTTVGAQLLAESLDLYSQRALWLTHTLETAEQAYKRLQQQFGGRLDQAYSAPGVLLAPGIGMVLGTDDNPSARLVVATRQSLHKKRLTTVLGFGSFDYVVIDEAHHALDANTYGEIVKTLVTANPAVKVVGLTATPSRTDKKALGTVFDEIVYQWLIPDGIATGHLTPIKRVKVSTKVDTSDVKTTAGDYNNGALMSLLKTANWQDLAVAAFEQHLAPNKLRTLAFLPSVAMSEEFAKVLRGKGYEAAHLDGETDKAQRQGILSDFVRGNIQVVSNMAVLTEGFDAPATDAILLARPTRSKTLFTQILGRGLRPYPGKDTCLLLDLTVQDTKALEMGHLLGRMVTCKHCATDYTAGLRVCPTCGQAQPAPEEREDDPQKAELPSNVVLGTGLVTEISSVFEKAFAAWYMGEDGYMSCGLGYNNGTLVIMPPLTDEYFRLAHVPREDNLPVKLVSMNEDLASLMLGADDMIKRLGDTAMRTTAKDAMWRGDLATPNQLKFLKKMGMKINKEVEITLSKGAASQMISHLIGVKRASTERWEVAA